MISRAVCKFIRMSPRKARLVADMVRGKSIDEAQAILTNLEVKPRHYVQETLKSAVANATIIDHDILPSDLYISKITIDGGPMFKRYRAGSMGRAMMIRHRMSHISIELDKKQVKPGKLQVTGHKPQVKEIKKPATKAKEKPKVKKMAAARKGK